MTCTFFGHRDCPNSAIPELTKCLKELIEDRGVDLFYVGNQGRFDLLVRSVLRKLSAEYPNIRYRVVLAYIPREEVSDYWDDFSETIVPEGIEKVPGRFAVSWRNGWMIERSDFVVSYVVRSWGGAANACGRARRQGKTVFNIYENIRQTAESKGTV